MEETPKRPQDRIPKSTTTTRMNTYFPKHPTPTTVQKGGSRDNEALTHQPPQIANVLHRLLPLFPAALLITLAACSSTPLPPESQWKSATYQQEAGGAGFGGQVVADTITTNATVVSIDAKQRTLVL